MKGIITVGSLVQVAHAPGSHHWMLGMLGTVERFEGGGQALILTAGKGLWRVPLEDLDLAPTEARGARNRVPSDLTVG